MISVILCFMGALFGIFALIKWFCILKPDVRTNVYNVIPIAVTTIAWLSAAVTFYQHPEFDSPIDAQGIAMIIGWVWLIKCIKHYRDTTIKQQKIINHLKAAK
jgi:membrane associated rhomboid family serine protease